jgi:hypothetical protein
MKISRKELSKLSHYELRNLGRQIGVKSPSTIRKDEVIDNIIAIYKGKKKPHFTNLGRPAIKQNNSFDSKDIEIEKQIDKMLLDLKIEIMNLIRLK